MSKSEVVFRQEYLNLNTSRFLTCYGVSRGQDLWLWSFTLCLEQGVQAEISSTGLHSREGKPSGLFCFLLFPPIRYLFFSCNSNSSCCFCACTTSERETDLLACWISWYPVGLRLWEGRIDINGAQILSSSSCFISEIQGGHSLSFHLEFTGSSSSFSITLTFLFFLSLKLDAVQQTQEGLSVISDVYSTIGHANASCISWNRALLQDST